MKYNENDSVFHVRFFAWAQGPPLTKNRKETSFSVKSPWQANNDLHHASHEGDVLLHPHVGGKTSHFQAQILGFAINTEAGENEIRSWFSLFFLPLNDFALHL